MEASNLNRALRRLIYAVLDLFVVATLVSMILRAERAAGAGEWLGWLVFFLAPYACFIAAVRWLGTEAPASFALLLGVLVGGSGTLVMAWNWPDLGDGVLAVPFFPFGTLVASVALGLSFRLTFHVVARAREQRRP